MTSSFTTSETFNIINARKLGAKVAADLYLCAQYYGEPTEGPKSANTPRNWRNISTKATSRNTSLDSSATATASFRGGTRSTRPVR